MIDGVKQITRRKANAEGSNYKQKSKHPKRHISCAESGNSNFIKMIIMNVILDYGCILNKTIATKNFNLSVE